MKIIVIAGFALAILFGLVLFRFIGSQDQNSVKIRMGPTLIFANISLTSSEGMIEKWDAESFCFDMKKEDVQTILRLVEKSENNKLVEEIPSSAYDGGFFIVDEKSRPFIAILLLQKRPYMRISRKITHFKNGFEMELKIEEELIYTCDEKLYDILRGLMRMGTDGASPGV